MWFSMGTFFLAIRLLSVSGLACKYITKSGMGLFPKQFVVLIIKAQLRIAQVEVGENFVLLEDVIAHHRAIRRGGQVQIAQLLVAFNQEIKLGLERGPGSFAIEALEERVVFRVAQVKGAEPLRQDLRQAALPHPDGSLDRDEPRRLVLGQV